MTIVVAVNAFRRGAGATQLAANLAALLALAGKRVGLIDADLPAPTLHHLLNVEPSRESGTLNDFLLGASSLDAVAIDLTADLANGPTPISSARIGRLYFVPATTDHHRATETLLSNYDVQALHDGLHELAERLDLDVLVVDTSAGTGKETLLTMALSDLLFVVLTLDQQEMQGTSVTIDTARKLSIPHTYVVVNKVTASYDEERVQNQVAEAYGCEVAAILPYADEIAELAGTGLFAVDHPTLPATAAIARIQEELVRGAYRN